MKTFNVTRKTEVLQFITVEIPDDQQPSEVIDFLNLEFNDDETANSQLIKDGKIIGTIVRFDDDYEGGTSDAWWELYEE